MASGNDWQPAFLIQLLTDPYDQVRFIAHRSLRGFEGYRPDQFVYDFWSPEEDLDAYQQTGFAKWATDNPPGSELGVKILELVGSDSLTAFLKRMTDSRDNTPIEIPE